MAYNPNAIQFAQSDEARKASDLLDHVVTMLRMYGTGLPASTVAAMADECEAMIETLHPFACDPAEGT